MDLLKYLEKRQLGYAEPKRRIHDNFIEQMGYLPKNNGYEGFRIITACKFSRNKNNLHLAAWSTINGKIGVKNTFDIADQQIYVSPIHDIPMESAYIHDFAWAEPQMKLVTACDKNTVLYDLNPSGILQKQTLFYHNTSARSIMFCPGTSNIFCVGCSNGTVNIWDSRLNRHNPVLDFFCDEYEFSTPSKVIFLNDQNVISCSLGAQAIKEWDLRYCRQIQRSIEVKRYFLHPPLKSQYQVNPSFSNIIINPQSTHLYACGNNNIIYCYALDSTERSSNPICKYTSFLSSMVTTMSISNNGRHLFNGYFKATGLMWQIDFPHIEKPVYKMSGSPDLISRIVGSDWCADPTCMKLMVSTKKSVIMLSILTAEERRRSTIYMECIKTVL